MTSNVSARAATSPELVKFRDPGDFVKLGLAIQHPDTVYTARINQTFDTLDGVAQLTYDGGSGTLADVLKNMLIFIGSAAGLYDKGLCRVRQLPTSTILYINQTSNIRFANNDYITIVNAMPIWQRDLTSTSGVIAMDYDIEFGNYQNGGVIARIGPLASVLKLTGASVDFHPVDPSLSACYDGATIVSYLYDAPGASATADLDTTSPTFTYDMAGEYRWSCSITDSLGRVTTAYRWLFINPDEVDFTIGEWSGDLDSGDWSCEVTCYDGVTRSEVYDNALVVLYADREFYNHVEGSIGKIEGYENLKFTGWIDGESIPDDFEGGEVTFTVRGPGHWLSKLRAFPFELQDTSSTPTSWKEIQEMTVDKALAHILFWTSTAPSVMDCFFTGDTTRVKILAQPSGSLMDQINAIASDRIFAKPLVNNHGQLYIEVDQQIVPDTERDSLPVVMDITAKDWINPLEIERVPTPRTSMVELGAVSDYDGTTSAQIHSRAPGTIGNRYGRVSSYDNYVIVDQDECNRIAGCLLAMENNEYEPLEINFGTNNPLIDIAPRQYCTISVAAEDTARGIVLTDVRLIPRRVRLVYDKENFILSTVVMFEFETGIGIHGGAIGIEYIPPVIADDNFPAFEVPDIGDFNVDFPSANLGSWFPPTVPSASFPASCNQFTVDSFSVTWDKTEVRGEAVLTADRIAKVYFPCTIHGGAVFPTNYTKTKLVVNGYFGGDSPTHYTVYGVKNGARVIAGTQDATFKAWWTFTSATPLALDGFELELDSGVGSITTYTPLDEIASGSVNSTNETGIAVTAVVDQYYSVESTSGGFWRDVGHIFPFSYALDLAVGGVRLTLLNSESAIAPFVRRYFQATATTVYARANDNPAQFADNVGTLGYIVRNARADGRRILISSLSIQNVCE